MPLSTRIRQPRRLDAQKMVWLIANVPFLLVLEP